MAPGNDEPEGANAIRTGQRLMNLGAFSNLPNFWFGH